MTMQRLLGDDEFVEFVARYLDGKLSDDDTSLLNATLRDDPEKRETFVDFCIQSQLIREYGASCLETSPLPESAPFAAEQSASFFSRRRVLSGAVILSTVAATILIAFSFNTKPTIPATIASLSHVRGDVFIESPSGMRTKATADGAIRVGDTIAVEQSRSLAVVKFEDGTQLQLDGNSKLMLDRPKLLRLDAGTLVANVAHQKVDQPLMLVTSHARVRVLGTTFAVAAAHDRTDISVDEGRVKVTNASDGTSVEVGGGEFTVADKQRDLTVRNIPQPPDNWSITFEDGLPPDWKHGVFKSEGLPLGSLGAVGAERVESDQAAFFQVCSPKQWKDGLFSIHEDTHLNITFKLEEPEWFQVFISTRPFDPDLPPTFLYRFKDERLWKWSNRGRWLRATIPLTAFERVPERKGTPPLGEVPFELLFSCQGDDRGLVIDQMSVSRGGPGKVLIERLDR